MVKETLCTCFTSLVLWTSACADQPIAIGLLLSISGNSAVEGREAWLGIRIAAALVPAVRNRPVRLILADAGSQPAHAALAIARLIEKEHAALVIGDVDSSCSAAASYLAERRGVPMISLTAMHPQAWRDTKYVWSVSVSAAEQGRAAAKVCQSHVGAGTAAIVRDIAQEYSIGLAAAFEEHFVRLGGSIVSKADCRTGDRDFSKQVQRFKALQPDIIYAPVLWTECALIARQVREKGLTAIIVTGDNVNRGELVAEGSSGVAGIVVIGHPLDNDRPTPLSARFCRRFRECFATDPNSCALRAADAYFLALDAISRAGSTDPEKIRSALASTSCLEGVTGPIPFGHDRHPMRPIKVSRIDAGLCRNLITVYPSRAVQKVLLRRR